MSRMDQEPDYGEPPYMPTPEEERAEAWEYWHQRACQLEAQNAQLRAALGPFSLLSEAYRHFGDYADHVSVSEFTDGITVGDIRRAFAAHNSCKGE